MELTVVAPQIADAGLDIQACVDTGLIQLKGLPIGAGNWVGNGVTFDGDYDVILVDTVNLAYNIGSGNCFTTDTMNVLIHPLPVISDPLVKRFLVRARLFYRLFQQVVLQILIFVLLYA